LSFLTTFYPMASSLALANFLFNRTKPCSKNTA